MNGIVIRPAKIVYWPIPKNACSLFKFQIAQRLGLGINGNIHRTKFEYTHTPIEGFTNVAIVRNPLFRLYSLWKNKIEADIDHFVFDKYPQFYIGMSFEGFTEEILKIPKKHADIHFLPQHRQIPKDCIVYKYEDASLLLEMLFQKRNASSYTIPVVEIENLISPQLLEKVKSYYEQDYRKFNYL